LPADLTETTQLMFPAQRLLRLLEGFLRGRAAGATALRFAAGHDQRRALPLPPTVFELTLAAPERDATRLARLLQERLARVQLAAPAIDLALVVERPQPFVPIHASLLPPAPAGTAGSAAASDADWLQLAETLHARLGSERVFQLQCIEDHRPECAWAMRPLGRPEGASRSAQREGNLVSPLGRPEGASRSAQRDGDPMIPLAAAAPAPASALAGHAAPQLPPRPALLLRTPQALACAGPTPQYRGPLHLLAGPERIESGWWDLNAPQRHPVFRDYFVARNPPGQTLWVFRALQAPHDWFLHGFFA
jgi:protein ImuB